MSVLPDSGARREFESGAVRDIQEGKGRCDLLPLECVAECMGELRGYPDDVLSGIYSFVESGDADDLRVAINEFINDAYDGDEFTAILELSKHYEDGAVKYSDRNWEKGIPLHCFIDSGVRHYLKYCRGDHDEPHDRAVLWNLFGAWWTLKNHPELDDITGDKKYGKRQSE